MRISYNERHQVGGDDIHEIKIDLGSNQYRLAAADAFQDHRGKHMEGTSQWWNECNNTNTDQVNLIHGEKTGVENASDENIKYGRKQCIQQDDHAASLLFLAPAI